MPPIPLPPPPLAANSSSLPLPSFPLLEPPPLRFLLSLLGAMIRMALHETPRGGGGGEDDIDGLKERRAETDDEEGEGVVEMATPKEALRIALDTGDADAAKDDTDNMIDFFRLTESCSRCRRRSPFGRVVE